MRERLVRAMLDNVLAALHACGRIARVLVVSPEQGELPPGVRWVKDPGAGLNEALEAAAPLALGSGATRLAVVFADLPLIGASDLEALLAVSPSHLALAPDHTGTGTNALCVPASAQFRFKFGPGSCALHRAEAERLGLSVRLLRRPALAFDIDTPADVEHLKARGDPRYAFLG